MPDFPPPLDTAPMEAKLVEALPNSSPATRLAARL